MITRFTQLVEQASAVAPRRIAVILPDTKDSLRSAALAQQRGIAQCALVGDVTAMRALAGDNGIDLSAITLIDEPGPTSAVQRAIDLCHKGKADVLVNDSAPLRVLLPAVLARRGGLRTGSLLSGVSVCELQDPQHLLLLTDGVMVVSPNLEERIAIVENAVRVATKLGIEPAHVALIAATETVNPKSLPSVQAAQITVMSKRHQLTGAIIDGPLGFDNAMSSQAAKVKDIASDVSGKVDILVAPDLAAGNLLLKTLSTLCQIPVVHVVVGGRTPLVLWSPTDDAQTRVAATALGVLCA
jgi:phosphotransacetylase